MNVSSSVIVIWLVDPDPETDLALWKSLCDDMNSWHGMKWECNKPSNSVKFMDLTILFDNGQLVTTIYEKDLDPYLYIPPPWGLHWHNIGSNPLN